MIYYICEIGLYDILLTYSYIDMIYYIYFHELNIISYILYMIYMIYDIYINIYIHI
jgi:hypothetical protein